MDKEQIIKSNQEQATAAWIDFLNQLRLNQLIERLNAQDVNLENALNTLQALKRSINTEVIERNRGSEKAMHGFIAERAQVAIANARNLIQGMPPQYYLIDDNGPVDIMRDDIKIQMKFVQKLFSLDSNSGVESHFNKYPWFVEQNGKYMIPKDYYEKVMKLLEMPAEEAKKLGKNNPDGLTYRNWESIRNFFQRTGLTPEDIEPSVLRYEDAQRDKIGDSINNEIRDIEYTDQQCREAAYEASKPTRVECAKATAVSAALEGGISFCLAYAQKRKSGKKVSDFTEEDWKEIGIDTGTGAVKGGIRGAAVYTLTNFTATPANVASSFVTAVYGVTAQAAALHRNEISEEDFLINSETICLDVTISAISSLFGQTLIPIPILGAIIGNTTGMILYDITKNYGSKKEQQCITGYRQEIAQLNEKLDVQYQKLVILLNQRFAQFRSLTEMAFDLDVNTAFAASIGLAYFCGVPESEILTSKEDIDSYFLY